MNKLELSQIMRLAEHLNKTEWISILISLNNKGEIESFFNMINKPDLLKKNLQDAKAR